MTDLKPHWLKIILIEIVGYDVKELKSEIDGCSFHSISEEQLRQMLDGEIAMPWRIQSILCDYSLMKIEGWDDLKCEELEVYAMLADHLEWFLNNKRKHIQRQRRLQALTDEYNDVLSIE